MKRKSILAIASIVILSVIVVGYVGFKIIEIDTNIIEEINYLSLEVETDKNTYETGENITITIVLSNERHENTTLSIYNYTANQFFFLTNSTGDIVWTTVVGPPPPWELENITIESDSEKILSTYVWNQTFEIGGCIPSNLTETEVPPGTYTIHGILRLGTSEDPIESTKDIIIS